MESLTYHPVCAFGAATPPVPGGEFVSLNYPGDPPEREPYTFAKQTSMAGAYMNSRLTGAFVFIAAFLILSVPLAAHHSSVFYDLRNPVTLKGEIQQVEWMNPHVYLYLDVQSGNGKVENWAVEMGAPNRITGVGWTKETLKPGMIIEVRGAPAKSRSPAGSALSAERAESNHYVLGGCITLPNGEKRAPSYGPPCT